MMRLRRLHAVTLIGGEPTLHPQLVPIVRHLASKRLRVALLSNGVLLNATLVNDLKRAGLHVIFLHIQSGQQRPDVPDPADLDQLRALRRQKAELIAKQGLEVGLSVIGYKSKLPEMRELVREVIDSPFIDLLLVGDFGDALKFGELTGDVMSGITGQSHMSHHASEMGREEVGNKDILDMMAQLGMRPFAYVGSSVDEHEPRWLTYWVAVARNTAGPVRAVNVTAGFSDRLLLRLYYWVARRHAYYPPVRPAIFRCQLLLNAISGGACLKTLRVVAASCRPGTKLERKRLTFQQGPNLTADGHLVFCKSCPDATILNGRLVPVCLADRFIEEESALRTETSMERLQSPGGDW